MRQQRLTTPIPDPTVLTTQQLQREISGARELVEVRVIALRELLEARFVGADTTLQVMNDRLNHLVDRGNEAIGHLHSLHDEKFKSIQTQFLERDRRLEQLSMADKTAVAAALQAQKEAAGAQNEANAASFSKSEANFTKAIEQTQLILNTVTKSMESNIDDLKTRMDKREGKSSGSADLWGYIIGGIGLLLAGITVVLLLTHFNR